MRSPGGVFGGEGMPSGLPRAAPDAGDPMIPEAGERPPGDGEGEGLGDGDAEEGDAPKCAMPPILPMLLLLLPVDVTDACPSLPPASCCCCCCCCCSA